MKPVQPHENKGGDNDAFARQVNMHGTGRAPLTIGTLSAQWKGGNGKPSVKLTEEGVRSTLQDVKV